MPNVNFYSDWQAQQDDIERRRKLADLLQKESMSPMQQFSGGGVVARNSPWEALSKIGKNYFAGQMQDQATADQRRIAGEMNTSRGSALSDMLKQYTGDPGGQNVPATGGEGDWFPQKTPATKPNPTGAAMSAMLSGDPQLSQIGGSLLANALKSPDSLFSKIDPKDYTPESIRAFAATKDPSVLVPVRKSEVANLGGVSGVYNPYDVKPGTILPHTQGPDSAARLAQQDQQWRGLSGYQQQTLPIQQGNLEVNQGQLANQQSNTYFNTGMGPGGGGGLQVPGMPPQGAPGMVPGGQPPQMPQQPPQAQPPMQQPPASQGQAGPSQLPRVQILQEELQSAQLALQNQNTPPDARQRAQQDVQSLTAELRRFQQGSAQGGPQGAPPAMQQGQVTPKVLAAREADRPMAQARLNEITASLTQLQSAADSLKTHPGMEGTWSATGATGVVAGRIPGTESYNAAARLETLKNQIALSALQKMREDSKTGGALGNVSNYEDALLANSVASLQNAQSTKQIMQSLDEVSKWSKAAVDRRHQAFSMMYQNAGEQQQTGGAQRNQSGGSAQIDDLVRKYTGGR